MNTCGACGAPNAIEARWCGHCGATLGAVAEETISRADLAAALASDPWAAPATSDAPPPSTPVATTDDRWAPPATPDRWAPPSAAGPWTPPPVAAPPTGPWVAPVPPLQGAAPPVQAVALGRVSPQATSGGMAIALAALVVIGGVAPLVSFAGEDSGAIVDEAGGIWFTGVLATTAVLGAIGAFRGHASGAALAGGVGLSTALLALITGRVLQLLSFGSDVSPHVGGAAFVLAALLGVVLAVNSLTLAGTARNHHGRVPLPLAGLAVLGTGLFLFGLLDPPEGISIADHIGGGDGFLAFAAWSLIGGMAVTAGGLVIGRSPIAAGLLAGQAAIWMFSWAAAATELPQSAFVSIPGGTASTAGIGVTLMTAASFAATAASAGRPVRDPRAAAPGPVQWALPVVALVVIGGLGAYGISEDQDEFGADRFDASSGGFDDSSDFDLDEGFDDSGFDDFEETDSFDSFVGDVEPGDTVDGFLEPGEVDVYAIDDDGSEIVVYVDGHGNDTTLTVVAGGSQLAYDDDSYGFDPEIVFLPNGSTAIEVRAFHSAETFGYTMYVDYCCGD